jgi:aspartate/methionine/tyrosine aminotransferase
MLTLAAARTPATKPTSFFEALLARPDLVWMGQNTTHLDPPPEVAEALLESIRNREYQLYAPPLGFEELKALIVEDLGLPGMDAMITDGAVGGLHHICTVLASDISVLVTTDPGWPWPSRFLGNAGVPVETLKIYSAEQRFKLQPSELAAVIKPKSLIYLIDPLNPLGSRYDRAELDTIVSLARATQSIVVHDCTYRHFADDHTLVASLYPEGTLTTYSFSKWLGLAGMRLGAIVAAPELLARFSGTPSNPLGASIMAQRAAIAGLKVKGPWLDMLRRVNRDNQRIVKDAIENSGIGKILVWPSHGNFLAADVTKGGWTGDALAAALLERDIFIRSGTYQSPSFGNQFIKISTSVKPEWVERFAEAVSSLPNPRKAG